MFVGLLMAMSTKIEKIIAYITGLAMWAFQLWKFFFLDFDGSWLFGITGTLIFIMGYFWDYIKPYLEKK